MTISLVTGAGVLTTVLPPLFVVVTGKGVSTATVEDATSRVDDESCGILVVLTGGVVVPSLLDPIEDVNPWSLEEDSAPEFKEVSEEPAEMGTGMSVLLASVVTTAVLLPPSEDKTKVSVVVKVVV